MSNLSRLWDSERKRSVWVGLFFLGLGLYATRPLLFHFTTHVPGWIWGDNAEYLWRMWWIKESILHLQQSPLFNPNIGYPNGFHLAYGEITPVTMSLAFPLSVAFGETIAYNALVLFSFMMTSFGAYLAVFYITRNRAASILSGVALTLLPYRYTRLSGHLPSLNTEWVPFFFLYLEMTLRDRKPGHALIAAVFYILNALTTWFYGVGLAVLVPFYLIGRMRPWRDYLSDKRSWLCASLFLLVSLGSILPFTVPYLQLRSSGDVEFPLTEVDNWSANLSDYFTPNPLHPIWGRWVRDHLMPNTALVISMEFFLFWGFTPTILAFYALRWRKTPLVRGLGIMGAVAWLLSLGLTLHFAGRPIAIPAPPAVVALYNQGMSWLSQDLSPLHIPFTLAQEESITIPMPALFFCLFVPLFNALRGWNRLGFLAAFAMVMLAGVGLVTWMDQELAAEAKPRLKLQPAKLRALGGGVFILFVLLELWTIPFGLNEVKGRPVDDWLAQQPGDFAVAHYPLGAAIVGDQLYYTTIHHKKIIHGSGTYFNNIFLNEYPLLHNFPDDSALDLLESWDVRWVTVDPLPDSADDTEWQQRIAAQPRLSLAYDDGTVRAYEVLP